MGPPGPPSPPCLGCGTRLPLAGLEPKAPSAAPGRKRRAAAKAKAPPKRPRGLRAGGAGEEPCVAGRGAVSSSARLSLARHSQRPNPSKRRAAGLELGVRVCPRLEKVALTFALQDCPGIAAWCGDLPPPGHRECPLPCRRGARKQAGPGRASWARPVKERAKYLGRTRELLAAEHCRGGLGEGKAADGRPWLEACPAPSPSSSL